MRWPGFMATVPGHCLVAILWALGHALITGVAKHVRLLPVQAGMGPRTSLTLADAVTTVCVSPDWASTPMCAFMPKR